jgi:(2R)-3-sulfolactate dehydrogenase (NADP+)
MIQISLDELHDLIVEALVQSRTSPVNAKAVARALCAAEADGHPAHGASRAPFYADQARSGKVDGMVTPLVERSAPGVLRVDARCGFAYPAVAAGMERVHDLVAAAGVAAVSVANSHHLGMVGYHIEPLAERGLLALAFSNSPAAIAPWGGNAAVFGTNPVALAAPREHDPPLVIDLSMAQVARGKIMMAASRGEPIPEDWALDAEGKPTTDAAAALAGTMMPMGGRKGAVLALLVELLAAGLTGSRFGHEAGSFFTAEGPPPGIGHLFIVFKPPAFSSGPLAARVDQLAAAILAQPGTRLPGNGRLAKRARARREGVRIAKSLLDDLHDRAAKGRAS